MCLTLQPSLMKGHNSLYASEDDSHYSLAGLNNSTSITYMLSVCVCVCVCREVLCSPLLLATPDRVDWPQCSVSKDEETKMATQMRTNFQPFDFTNEL